MEFSPIFSQMLPFIIIVIICWPNVAQATIYGANLRVAAETWTPWVIMAEDHSDGIPSYSGVMRKVMEYLKGALNFTTVIVRAPDGAWGSEDKDGNWNGMVGMVHRNEVDFALGMQSMLL